MTSANFSTVIDTPKTNAHRPFWARLFELVRIERAARNAAAANVAALSDGFQQVGRAVAKLATISDRQSPCPSAPIAPAVAPMLHTLRRPGLRTQWKGAHRVAISAGR